MATTSPLSGRSTTHGAGAPVAQGQMARQNLADRLLFIHRHRQHGVLADLRRCERLFVERTAKGVRFQSAFAVAAAQAGLQTAFNAGQPDVLIEPDALASIGLNFLGRYRSRKAQDVSQDVAVGIFAPGTRADGNPRQIVAAFLDGERGVARNGARQPRGRIRRQPRLAQLEPQIVQTLAGQYGQVGEDRAFTLGRQLCPVSARR